MIVDGMPKRRIWMSKMLKEQKIYSEVGIAILNYESASCTSIKIFNELAFVLSALECKGFPYAGTVCLWREANMLVDLLISHQKPIFDKLLIMFVKLEFHFQTTGFSKELC